MKFLRQVDPHVLRDAVLAVAVFLVIAALYSVYYVKTVRQGKPPITQPAAHDRPLWQV